MKKKKWLYIVLIILLAVPVLFLYNAFNGNPISKQLSKKTLNNYLEKTYPDDEFTIGKPFYNFKDNGYNYSVIKIGVATDKNYDFSVSGLFGSTVHYDGIYYENQDTALISKLGKEASDEITTRLQEKVPQILYVEVQLEILKGKYDANTVWSKDFQPEKPMYIYIVIDAHDLSKDNLLQATKTIQTVLNDNHYDYDHATINANIINDEVSEDDLGYVKYGVSFEKDTQLKLKQITEYND